MHGFPYPNHFVLHNFPAAFERTTHLKKVALVLAFACAFTMFAGAAFTDQSDIAVDSDVVDTMTALGVIEGYLDGSFRPDDTVTRGEMAKMIYVCLLYTSRCV